MASRRRWIPWVVVGAVFALAIGFSLGHRYLGLFPALLGERAEDQYSRLAQTQAKLVAARTARITFTASVVPEVTGPAGAFAGTTRMDFTATDPAWTTDFDKVGVPGQPAMKAKLVHVGDATYVSSPSFIIADRKPWVRPDKVSVFWRSQLARPDIGINDFPVWQKVLNRISQEGAAESATDKLADVPGAPHEYSIYCGSGHVACPPPFLNRFDRIFSDFSVPPRVSAWYGDDGLLRRLDVAGSAGWFDRDSDQQNLEHVPYGTYFYKVSFTLDQFGAPVQVAAPADNQISKSPAITLRPSTG